MNVVSIFYPVSESSTFDADYYLNTHMEMAKRFWKDELVETRIVLGVAGLPEGKPLYHAVLDVVFKSPEAMGAALTGQGMAELGADTVNYTNVTPVVQISKLA